MKILIEDIDIQKQEVVKLEYMKQQSQKEKIKYEEELH